VRPSVCTTIPQLHSHRMQAVGCQSTVIGKLPQLDLTI
jgi:hypothetical protein